MSEKDLLEMAKKANVNFASSQLDSAEAAQISKNDLIAYGVGDVEDDEEA